MSDAHEAPVLLAEFPNEALAAIFVATLREEGIESATTGAMTAGFRTEAPGMVRVLVHQPDVPRAQALLETFRQAGASDDED